VAKQLLNGQQPMHKLPTQPIGNALIIQESEDCPDDTAGGWILVDFKDAVKFTPRRIHCVSTMDQKTPQD
jgi:hypothetical protein